MSKPTGGLLFCGDPHGSYRQVRQAAEMRPDCPVILLGDLEPSRPLPDELGLAWERTWLIHGNHDTDQEAVAQHVWAPEAAARSLHARVVELGNGLRIAGLGGVFRERVWHPDPASHRRGQPVWPDRESHARGVSPRDRWRGGVPMQHWSSIYIAEVEALRRLQADVLVLHEAPGYHPHGFDLLDELARAMGASLVVHGHHHDSMNSSARWAGQKFRSFGVGLRGVTWIDPFTGAFELLKRGD